MLSWPKFVDRFCSPRNAIDRRTAGRIRLAVAQRMKGNGTKEIAAWLEVSPATVRGYLKHVGVTVRTGWQRGSYYAHANRLHALGLHPLFLERTGAVLRDDCWWSRDSKFAPSKRWFEKMELARARYRRRQARHARLRIRQQLQTLRCR
jgi:hypothetical protein